MAHVVVVGAGPIGSATARHLITEQHEVTLIGPGEPADHQAVRTDAGGALWSAHYDESRIAAIDAMYIPSLIGLRAIRRYADLEADSGVSFTARRPLLTLFDADPDTDPAAVNGWRDREGLLANIAEFGGHAEVLDATALAERFPGLSLPADQVAVLQDDAILVSPRSFTRAQQELAVRNGAHRSTDEVVSIEGTEGDFRVHTREGNTITADRVVLATGAFTNVGGLLPRPIAAEVFGCTVVLLEVAEGTESFPTLMYTDDHFGGGIIAPPLRYPDGRWYVKCAGGQLLEEPLTSYEQIGDWVAGGGAASEIDYYRAKVADLLPDLEVLSAKSSPCLPTFNSTGLPFIDHVADGVVLATEGERGVMMADEIGRLAARLVLDRQWTDPMPHQLFRVQYA